jgi:outer membrane protein OmpA-like peptidoglycan-associated protein
MRVDKVQPLLGFWILLMLVVTNAAAGDMLHGPAVGGAATSSREGSVIIYRGADADISTIPVIYVNGRIAGTLMPGEYAQATVCTSDVTLRIGTRGAEVAKGESHTVHIGGGMTAYVKVTRTRDNTFVGRPVDPVRGHREVAGMEHVSNVINRFVPEIVLGSDGLFAFGSAELLPSVKEKLGQLVEDIVLCEGRISSIRVVGHTDRIGSAATNKKLSVKRAESVAAYLVSRGVKSHIDIEGRGEEEPVTTNCIGEGRSPELIECLQPDRRVVIELLSNVCE